MPPSRILRFFFRISAIVLVLAVAGCGRFRPKPAAEYVYVSVKGTFLRDRVAAVTNRVAEVTNGQRLQVLEHGRRFLKVKTDKGETGWIEEHAIIDQKVYDVFSALQAAHAHDPVIATGVLRDDSYLHEEPGRKTEHFYLLPENDKLQLLVRASVPKPAPPQAPVPVAPVPSPKEKPASALKGAKGAAHAAADAPAKPPGPVLEDYWLIRDQQGFVGWVRSRALDVDVPDAIAGLAEGQRIVGAYVLKKVADPNSDFPDKMAPEYIAVLAPYKDGLPYDFDQARVFTWNVKKHRYETAYRERNMEGFLPVTVGADPSDAQVPVFSWKVAADNAAAIDPQTGIAHPAQTTVESFRMEGVVVRRTGPGVAPPSKKAPAQAGERPKAPSRRPARARRATRPRHRRRHAK
ncbi:SH3 domain-containing protein [Acidipila sp. 4G-K13]|uniref:SH3 domain-containing protein n=2 Tax=Paracidobacterium acidisoli TaxID=2303751 RepID=A0A372IL45_9BACT|nr:SH3 domain-containing protein [Paracidobacterium acidisoli]